MSNLGEQQHPPNHDISQSPSASKRKSSRCCSNHLPLDQKLEFEPSPPPSASPDNATTIPSLASSDSRCMSPAVESPPPPAPMDLDCGVLDVHRLTDAGRFKAAQASRALKSHLPHAYHEAWKPTGGATPIPSPSSTCTIPSSLPPLPSPLPSNGSLPQNTQEDACHLEYRQPKRARLLPAELEPSSSDYTQNPIPGSSSSTASTSLASSTRFPNPLRGVSSTIKSKATQSSAAHYHSSRRLFASSRSRLFKPTYSRVRRQAQKTSSVESRASSLPPDYGRSPLFSDHDDDDFQNRHHPHGPFWYKLRMTPTTPTTPSHTQPPLSSAAGNPNPSTKGKERDNVESVSSLQTAAINAALGSNVSRSAAGLGEASPSSSSGSPPVSAGPSSSCMVGSNHPIDDASRSMKPLLNHHHHIRLPLPTMPSNIPNSYSLPSVTSPMSSASRASAQSPFARIALPQVSLRVSIGSASSSASSSNSTPATSPLPVHAPPHVPSIYPLINRETLRELDLEVILRSPQLRHDLLFDPGLQFRPTSGRRKRDATEKYWEAIAREMEWGCTCTSFDERGRLYTCVCGKAPQGHRAAILPGSVFKASSLALHPGFVAHLRATQSRIMPLLTTLRDVLGSVIHPSSTIASPGGISPKDPSPSPPLTPTSQSSFSSDAPPSPTTSTSTTDSLLSSLDPSLIEQEIRHGVFDYQGVFKWVGEVMKMHCAPMRDAMVENMVRVASGAEDTPQSGRGAVKGLRMCFEILEVMKLDIANHQLQALRPYLLDTSSDFELKTFQERYEKGLAGLSVTQRWMSDAARAVQPAFAATTPRVDKSKFVMTALCHAMVNLAFKPPLPSPPAATTEIKPSSSRKHSPVDSSYPETLYLDHARLQSYFNDASDLLGLYMLVMLFRQLTTVGSKAGTSSLEDWEIDRIKREVWEVGPSRLGMCFDVNLGEVPNAAEVEAKWQKGMNDVMLQVGMRAEEARERFNSGQRSDPATKSSSMQPPKPETQTLIQNWMRSNYRKDSPLQKIMKDRLSNAVLEVVKDNVLGSSTSAAKVANSSPSSRMKKVNLHRLKTPPPAGKSAGNGLEPLVPEIMHLGERIARLVLFHGKVYKRLYEVEGFLQL